MTDSTRRRVLGIGGTALLAGLAGCSFFEDQTGVPGRDEAEQPGGEHTPDGTDTGAGREDEEGTFGSQAGDSGRQ